ncbi:2,4-dienoyl-CoA reductase-like NADH-dependent reductase (Old Yellow Enzyme family) [Saccharopolyspora erythraea NRRL 2338]|uniref:NADH-dependent flavin oxidoreductase, Oye family n=2 Tax=Saccharopolyspora erythraea TaxID=1836 RepID=A4FJR5_SACEN|nr:NADH:flavin oxidoreductase [Saccharopolyspora erythraea]EQD86058.1 12-oxophytodienoate reductase [Saccharopolyspora erythraea D]PFG97937.1 2,4-dienoyl-CoA reductase-like NADH-dependent reductase (Old Yellow Enzyme family) [Saccharopolyspora erythraea NRRL 2338]QRK88068.1 NADH:flavin oxidoreductase [Saccharopolyspora erythraea]CAM04290.1 NADH-dependent flavin oxidoreductase, Oye family [Saccharopolyspora erythraea NRRL 2338]
MSTRAAQALSRPFTLGSATLANRIVMAPMTRQHSPGGVPGEDVAAYYARRAAAGTGLIITEGTFVDHRSAGFSGEVPRFHGEQQLAGWSRVVEAVHAHGGKIMPQIWHVGIQRPAGAPPFPEAPSVGPSGLALDGTPAGEAMTLSDIDDVIRAFADAAQQAERIGFDGVELHGAHGYLIDQFLWERTNRRTDSYGGDLVSRTKFAADIVAAIRERVAPDFPVVLRFSQWKADHYDARLAEDPGELETVLTPLADAGVDAFHASGRRYWQPEFPDSGSNLNIAGWTKKVTGKPVITVGSVGLDSVFEPSSLTGAAGAKVESIELLLDRLEQDEFDLVAVGRALLADPQWADKVLNDRLTDLVAFNKDAVQSLH